MICSAPVFDSDGSYENFVLIQSEGDHNFETHSPGNLESKIGCPPRPKFEQLQDRRLILRQSLLFSACRLKKAVRGIKVTPGNKLRLR